MPDNDLITIALLGASFDTGNLGVSALAESSIKCILHRWPDAEIVIIGAGRSPAKTVINIEGRPLSIKSFPIRICPNVFVKNHYIKILLITAMLRIINIGILKRKLGLRNDTFGALCRADLIADITGGDSFSDIYGMKRFILGYLSKRLCQLTGKPFILLPQTYGPFKHKLSRMMAKNILKNARKIYSRDSDGLQVVESLISKTDRTQVSPDVAFVLDARKPNSPVVEELQALKDNNKTIIGLNVSGLLYNAGYTGKNEFGLKVDYPGLVNEIIDYFTALPNTIVLLTPHVFPKDSMGVENDSIACIKIYQSLSAETREKIILLEGEYDQGEMKYLISQCDFFMGARMHSCIAAISQCVPTVGMAYSKKFAGVFETVGLSDCIVEMRKLDIIPAIEIVKNTYRNMDIISTRLQNTMRVTETNVISLFDTVDYYEK